jgi:hypothetical protein
MKYIFSILAFVFPVLVYAHSGSSVEPVKCGTCLSHQEIRNMVQICNFDFAKRHIMQKTYTSPSGKFLIHYDISGEHAVAAKDANANGVPDYIDSVAYYADYSYQKEVIELGYYSPMPEPGGINDLYDIYIYELGKSAKLYGLTQADRAIQLPSGDNGYDKFHSFIAIDNDYSPSDSVLVDNRLVKAYTTDGIDALKITLIHEFHHAIQYVYGNITFGTLYAELTSTYMENRFFPEIKDYYQYVKYLFESLYKYPFGKDDYKAGYAYSIFGQYLYKNFGDNLLRRSWELIDEINNRKISYVDALDSAFREQGTDFLTEWKNFQPYMYFTGSRALGDLYLEDAKYLPEVKFYQIQAFDNGRSYSSGVLSQLEQRCVRFVLKYSNASNDTLDIFMTNLDTKHAGTISDYKSNYNLQCSAQEFDNAINEQGKDVYWSKEDPDNITHFIPYLGKGDKSVFVDFAFPNPYIPGKHQGMYIPVPEINNLYNKINVVVFSANMQEIFAGTYDFVFMDNNQVVIDISDEAKDLQSGVYLYKISTPENDYLGKFAVKVVE